MFDEEDERHFNTTNKQSINQTNQQYNVHWLQQVLEVTLVLMTGIVWEFLESDADLYVRVRERIGFDQY